MAKPVKKANLVHQTILGGLIETKPTSWERKTLGKDDAGKEIVNTTKVPRQGLRFPLAQNVSELNVERASKAFAK